MQINFAKQSIFIHLAHGSVSINKNLNVKIIINKQILKAKL